MLVRICILFIFLVNMLSCQNLFQPSINQHTSFVQDSCQSDSVPKSFPEESKIFLQDKDTINFQQPLDTLSEYEFLRLTTDKLDVLFNDYVVVKIVSDSFANHSCKILLQIGSSRIIANDLKLDHLSYYLIADTTNKSIQLLYSDFTDTIKIPSNRRYHLRFFVCDPQGEIVNTLTWYFDEVVSTRKSDGRMLTEIRGQTVIQTLRHHAIASGIMSFNFVGHLGKALEKRRNAISVANDFGAPNLQMLAFNYVAFYISMKLYPVSTTES